MKHNLFVALSIALFVLSCSEKESPEQLVAEVLANSEQEPSRSNSVSMQDLSYYLTTFKNLPETKSTNVDIQPIVEGADTLLYLVNYEHGWELLTADIRAPRVIAKADDGNMQEKDLFNNPAAADVYSFVKDNIKYLKEHPEEKTDNRFSDSWETVLPSRLEFPQVVSVTVTDDYYTQDHLTQTRWGQGYPWNIRAPYKDVSSSEHCYTGCTPVAVSQILYYLHYKLGVPTNLYRDSYTNAYIHPGDTCVVLQPIDISFYNSGDYWDDLPLTASESNSYFDAVSTLMVQQGLCMGSVYCLHGTGTTLGCSPSAFTTQYPISCSSTDNVSINHIISKIYNNQIPTLLTVGRIEPSDVHKLHDVVADASQKHVQTIVTLYREPVYYPVDPPFPGDKNSPTRIEWHYFTVTEVITSNFIGINWGWDGTGMYSGASPIWYSVDGVMSWSVGSRTYTYTRHMVTDFASTVN